MNNPPAFPLHNHGAQTLGLHVTGMTLRDYFAAKAMQAMETRNASGTDYSRAIHAYEMADAMMKAREA
jgi:hypothetical protein